MPKKRSDLRILFLQIRNDNETRKEEFDEFVRFSGLDESQIVIHNVFDTPRFNSSIVDPFDALFVGGSSDASVLKPKQNPFLSSIFNLLIYCVKISKPVFASCFGFQSAVVALGGKMIHDKKNMEIGSYQIKLHENAKKDLILKDVQNPFWAISGHAERAEKLPKNTILLASTPRCSYHAFKIKGKPFYAFQFHPEIDKKDLIARLTRYKDRYLKDDEEFQRIIDKTQECPEANKLVSKFVERMLLR